MTYGLNYVTPSDLFNYGFKLTKNDNYIYRVVGHSGFKSKIYVYFQIDLDENRITYEVRKMDQFIIRIIIVILLTKYVITLIK